MIRFCCVLVKFPFLGTLDPPLKSRVWRGPRSLAGRVGALPQTQQQLRALAWTADLCDNLLQSPWLACRAKPCWRFLFATGSLDPFRDAVTSRQLADNPATTSYELHAGWPVQWRVVASCLIHRSCCHVFACRWFFRPQRCRGR